ncbi:hypothetical protein ACIQXD_34735 [Streptomyces uncialis]|uniref:hypothetical protein n=1 Tax=Streptomyces uncialis TaxID=1048205 RepID=UPI00380C5F5C
MSPQWHHPCYPGRAGRRLHAHIQRPQHQATEQHTIGTPPLPQSGAGSPPCGPCRHGKAIAALTGAAAALDAADIPLDAPGVLTGDEPTAVLEPLLSLLHDHRVRDRFPAAI